MICRASETLVVQGDFCLKMLGEGWGLVSLDGVAARVEPTVSGLRRRRQRTVQRIDPEHLALEQPALLVVTHHRLGPQRRRRRPVGDAIRVGIGRD